MRTNKITFTIINDAFTVPLDALFHIFNHYGRINQVYICVQHFYRRSTEIETYKKIRLLTWINFLALKILRVKSKNNKENNVPEAKKKFIMEEFCILLRISVKNWWQRDPEISAQIICNADANWWLYSRDLQLCLARCWNRLQFRVILKSFIYFIHIFYFLWVLSGIKFL
jgi:hypothetical protein